MSEHGFDLTYEIDSDIPPRELWKRDDVFYFDTVDQEFAQEIVANLKPKSTVLEVASGDGSFLSRFGQLDANFIGLEPSKNLNLSARDKNIPNAEIMAGISEKLPLRDKSVDIVTCKGSLDHFNNPNLFISEASRVLKSDGKLILAMQNFESASCKISRASFAARKKLGLPHENPHGGRPYWEIPENHTFKGDLNELKKMVGEKFDIEKSYGVSMLWLLPMWRRALGSMSEENSKRMLSAANKIAHKVPSQADMLVAVCGKKLAR